LSKSCVGENETVRGAIQRLVDAGILGAGAGAAIGATVSAGSNAKDSQWVKAVSERWQQRLATRQMADGEYTEDAGRVAIQRQSPSQGDVPATPPAVVTLPKEAIVQSRPIIRDLPLPKEAAPAATTLKAKIRQVESGGKDSAKNPRSTASGRYQFTDGTWRALGGDPAKKNDPAEQERMMDKLTAYNATALQRGGVSTTAGNMYLAHFLGAGGALAAHRNPGAAVAERVQNSNPFTKGWTNAQLIAWADRKMGGKANAADYAEDAGPTRYPSKRQEMEPLPEIEPIGDTALEYEEGPVISTREAEPSDFAPPSEPVASSPGITEARGVINPTAASQAVPQPVSQGQFSLPQSSPKPVADRVSHILAESPVANVDAIRENAASRLDEAKNRNPAAIALEGIRRSRTEVDYTQPLSGEEPMFDETQSEVV
jgi:hypothetical protein